LDQSLIKLGDELRNLRKTNPDRVRQILSELSNHEAQQVFYCWELWARPNQLVKDYHEGWPEVVIVYCIGRGGGKTRLASEWIRKKATRKATEIALIGPTAAKVRDIQVLGPSGIIGVHPPSVAPSYEPSYSRVSWKNGSVGKMFSAEKGDRIRGGNFEIAWYDELGEVFDPDPFDQAMLALRVGESRMLVTTTPRLGNESLIELWKNAVFNDDPPQEGKFVRIITGSTYENLDNLSPTFKAQVLSKYEGTRLAAQEIEGKMLFESEGALWNVELITNCTLHQQDTLPEMDRICIGVDPAVTTTAKSDKTGIVVAGLSGETVYVLGDFTDSYTPQGWVNKVHHLYDMYSDQAPCSIVVERNQGGDLLTQALTKDRPFLPVDTVFSTRNKIARAEPVAILYEQNKVKHVRGLGKLEEEMCTYEGNPKQSSPNRLDGLVFAITHLVLGEKRFSKRVEFIL